jgi:hypothetical protein
VRRIDDDRAGGLAGAVVDDLATELRPLFAILARLLWRRICA